MNTQADLIVEIIDGNIPYKINRRPYNEDFAEAHGIKLSDIEEKRFIPCLECGQDIAARILLGQYRNKIPVYCSSECRAAHGRHRIMKFNDRMDINAVAKMLTTKCLIVTPGEHIRKPRSKGKLSLIALTTETNSLLRDILQELRK